MKRKIMMLAVAALGVATGMAYDFSSVNADGVTIYYDKNSDGTSVSVTYKDTDYNSYTGEVAIPETVTEGGVDYKVTAIGDEAFYLSKNVTTVTLPNTIETIGASAFYFCKFLKGIELPEGLTSIGAKAFQKCETLTVVTIPNTVTTIGNKAFYDCIYLSEAGLGAGLQTIGDESFAYCGRLKGVRFPEGMTTIGAEAFKGCQGLEAVYVPGSVTEIGAKAFTSAGLKEMTVNNPDPTTITLGTDIFASVDLSAAKLYVPEESVDVYKGAAQWSSFGEVTAMPPYDFAAENADGVTIYYVVNADGTSVSVTYKSYDFNTYSGAVVVPDSVTNDGVTYTVTGIGEYAFDMCKEMTSVTLPITIETIGRSAFHFCKGLTSIELPVGLTSIGFGAFNACEALTQVEIPITVTTIENKAFNDCKRLSAVTLGNGLQSLGEEAFAYCAILSEITMPYGLTTIGAECFKGCQGLEKVYVPGSVTEIGARAFTSTNIAAMTVNNPDPTTITLGADIFGTVDLSAAKLYVPEGCVDAYKAAAQWEDFGEIVEYGVDPDAGVSELTTNAATAEAWYDLQGRRVTGPRRGIYVRSGHKVIVR